MKFLVKLISVYLQILYSTNLFNYTFQLPSILMHVNVMQNNNKRRQNPQLIYLKLMHSHFINSIDICF